MARSGAERPGGRLTLRSRAAYGTVARDERKPMAAGFRRSRILSIACTIPRRRPAAWPLGEPDCADTADLPPFVSLTLNERALGGLSYRSRLLPGRAERIDEAIEVRESLTKKSPEPGIRTDFFTPIFGVTSWRQGPWIFRGAGASGAGRRPNKSPIAVTSTGGGSRFVFELGHHLPGAIGAETVGEFELGALRQVGFDLLPITLVVAHLVARAAKG